MTVGKVHIIPSDDILEDDFEKDIYLKHQEAMQEFSNKYNLGYHFKDGDYHDAPCELARLGHCVIKTENNVNTFIAYLPEIITDRQRKWFEYNYRLSDHVMYGAFSLYHDENSNEEFKQITGKMEIMQEVINKNKLYERTDKHVR